MTAIFYEYIRGNADQERALRVLDKWYNIAKNLAPEGTDLTSLKETYEYYKERIKTFSDSEIWYYEALKELSKEE